MEINAWQKVERLPPMKKEVVQLYKFDKREVVDMKSLLKKCNYLNQEEIERSDKFKYEKDRTTFVLSRSLLRFLISEYLTIKQININFIFNRYGKPMLNDFPDFHFNISHSSSIILLGIGCQPLGVDVEVYNEDINYLELANSVFSNLEIKQLTKLNNENIMDGFYNIWTKKEAYIKALGKGLHIPLDDFSMKAFDEEYHNILEVNWDPKEIKNWKAFNLLTNNNYGGAICCKDIVRKVELLDITEFFEKSINSLFTTN